MAACDRTPSSSSAGASLLDPSDTARTRSDPARNRTWIVGARGVFLYSTSTGQLVEVTLPSWQWVDAPYGCPPDLAIGPDGAALVTSNIVPVLWRIDPKTLAVSMHELALDADREKDVGFSGLAYSAEHAAWFAVSGIHGSLWRIDPSLRQARKIARVAPVDDKCLALPHAAG
jgi:streptogramin lyase